MKKLIALVLCLLMVTAMFAGCAKQAATTETPADTSATTDAAAADTAGAETPASTNTTNSDVRLSLGTSSLGGNFFTMGAAMAAVFMDDYGYSVTAQATNGSGANIVSVLDKELDLGMAQANSIASAAEGTGQFEGNQIAADSGVCTLFNWNSTPVHILVRRSLGVDNLEDLAKLSGLKVECMNPGDGFEDMAKKFTETFGFTNPSFEYSGSRVQLASRLKNGEIDVTFDGTGLGSSWMADVIGDGSDFMLLSLTDEQTDLLCGKYSEMTKLTIPAVTYGGVDEDVHTVGFWTTLLCNADLDEEVAYNLTKSVYENKDALVKAHAFFADLDPQNVVDSVIYPLHPGAERYYKEVGVLN